MNSYGKNKKIARDSAVFGMFAAMMFVSKCLMEVLPNIHLLAFFIGTLTVVYRSRALIPLYVYIFLDGLIHGFSLWWIPYLYIFLPLFVAFLLLPKNLPRRAAVWLYPLLCALHGLSFGTLYAPAQALLFHLDFEETLVWIAAGIPFDLIHALSNAAFGALVLPFSLLLQKWEKNVV